MPKTQGLKNMGIIFSIGKEKNKDFLTEVVKKSSQTPAPSMYLAHKDFAPRQRCPSIPKSPRYGFDVFLVIHLMCVCRKTLGEEI